MTTPKMIAEKAEKVKQIKEKVESADLLILTDYSGMTVKQMTELRRKLDRHQAEFKVFKNTMINRALSEKMADLKSSLTGPIAVLLGYAHDLQPLKILVKFAEEEEKPKVLSGVVEGVFYEKEKILALSALPGREELLTQMLYGLKSPLYGLVNVLSGNIRKLVYVLEAIKNKKSQGGEK